jgi:hypothetical protein
VAWASAAVVFAVYLATLAPTVQDGDGPELTLAAASLGVPHPTGYPLYTLLGFAWTRLVPLGDAAYRMNLASAAYGAGAVGVLVAALQRLGAPGPAAWLAGGLLAFAPTFWSQSNTAEVYSLQMLLQALLVWALAAWARDGRRAWLRGGALALGLGLAHHGAALLSLPLLVAAVAHDRALRREPREWLVLSALAASPLLLYAYLPLAASREPMIAWGRTTTLVAVWQHVSGAQYRGLFDPPALLAWPGAVAAHGVELARQFGPWFFPFAAAGALALLRAAPPVLLGSAFAWAACVACAASYRVVDVEPYALPAHLWFALWVGAGAGLLMRAVRSLDGPLATAAPRVLAVVPALPLLVGWPVLDRSDAYGPHDRAVAALAVAPEGSLLLTRGPSGYATVYGSLARGLRPDVVVVDAFLRLRPRYGEEFEAARARRADAALPGELAVVKAALRSRARVMLWPDAPDLDWRSIGLLRIRRGLLDELVAEPPDLRVEQPPASSLAARFGDSLELVAAEVEPAEVARAGVARLRLYWRGLGAPPGASSPHVVALLARADGELITDGSGRALLEHEHPLGQGAPLELGPGALFAETVDLLVPRRAPPGAWQLWVGVSADGTLLRTGTGAKFAPAAPLVVAAGEPALWTLPERAPARAAIARVGRAAP